VTIGNLFPDALVQFLSVVSNANQENSAEMASEFYLLQITLVNKVSSTGASEAIICLLLNLRLYSHLLQYMNN
jgi:hypothetical protein